MAGGPQKQWIVLLDKSPRGPFSESEMGELLKQGTLRRSDFAFLVPEKPGEGQALWRFIWQFPEFDSRRGEKENPPPAAVLEKRNPKTEEEIKAQIKNTVPLDLQAITADDLIIRAHATPKRDILPASFADEKEKSRTVNSFGNPSRRSSGGIAALFSILALISILYVGFKNRLNAPREKADRGVAQEIKRAGSSAPLAVPQARTIQETSSPKKSPMPAPSVAQPKERDRGDIREDELLRIREEERRQEAAERERERQQDDETNRDDEEEERPDSRKKGKRKRQMSSEENEDKMDEEALPNSQVTEDEEDQSSSALE